MNHWQGTAILKNDPIFVEEGGQTTVKFTACNTAIVRDPSGAILARQVLWLDCRWVNPYQQQVARFKARSLVFLEGALYQRDFTREDGSSDWSVALEMVNGTWRQDMKGSHLLGRDSSAE